MPGPVVEAYFYRVRNWAKYFENHESRKLKSLTWLPVPNKHDGRGYRRVVALPNSVQVFCGWCLILEVASKMPTRGVLRDDDGALTASDLAAKTGFPEAVFAAAFQALIRPEIGWLEMVVSNEAGDSPGIRRSPPPQGKGMEEKGTEDGEGSARTRPHAPMELAVERPKPDGVGTLIVPQGSNAPLLADAQAYFAEQNRREGTDWQAAEVKMAWMTLDASKDEFGQWYWGKRLVGDWRSAMEVRLGENRKHERKNESGTALEKYGAGSRRNAGTAPGSDRDDIRRAVAARAHKDA